MSCILLRVTENDRFKRRIKRSINSNKGQTESHIAKDATYYICTIVINCSHALCSKSEFEGNIQHMQHIMLQKTSTYCEEDGKRQDSFSRATKHIAWVVRSVEYCL